MIPSGEDLFAHVAALFPICRSISGNGLRQTLRYIARHVTLEVHEVPSGTAVLDWEVPAEWNIRAASIRRLSGETVVDFARNNLHILQYSAPLDAIVPRDELEAHLFSLPEQPDFVPYRTAYYADTWGFCLAHRVRLAMSDPAYRVHIDASLAPGSMSLGECLLAGSDSGEVLISVHCCHPSLANDNLSGIAVAIGLAQALAERPRRFSYRFLFAPGTIGAIAWLHFNRDAPARIRHGLVLSCLGDAGPPTYKRSRRGDALIDRYATQALREVGHADRVRPFIPYGYDERQYCSPGFNLPVGRLTRSPNGSFPEYHTSADDLGFVRPQYLAASLHLLLGIVDMIEQDRVWYNQRPFGEPQLGRRGLYRPIGGATASDAGAAFDQMALLWVLNLSDGGHSLLDIAERSGKRFGEIAAAAAALAKVGLLAQTAPPGAGSLPVEAPLLRNRLF